MSDRAIRAAYIQGFNEGVEVCSSILEAAARALASRPRESPAHRAALIELLHGVSEDFAMQLRDAAREPIGAKGEG